MTTAKKSARLALVDPSYRPVNPFPHDTALEMLVLKYMVEYGDCVHLYLAAGLIEEIFYHHDTRITFGVICQLRDRGYTVTLPVVRAEVLDRKITFDDIVFFEQFTNDVVPRPIASNIPLDVARLRELYEIRRLRERLGNGQDAALAAGDYLAATRGALRQQMPLHSDLEILDQPDPEPLIPGYWWHKSIAANVAPPGTGKTALFVSKGVAIASGTAWLGITPARRGPVVLSVGEGAAFMKYRVLAAKLRARLDLDVAIGFHVLPQAIDFRDRRQVLALIERLRPLQPALLGVDTLARHMPGGDDSSQQDIGAFFGHCDLVRDELGCAVEVLHHTGWNEDRERGSSALRGHVDTLTLLSKDADDVLRLHVEKQKDGPELDDLRFRLTPLSLGSGHSACVIDAIDTIHEDQAAPIAESYRLAFDVLRQTFPSGARQTQWLDAMPESFGSGEAKRQKLYRARRELLQLGWIAVDPKGQIRVSQEGGL